MTAARIIQPSLEPLCEILGSIPQAQCTAWQRDVAAGLEKARRMETRTAHGIQRTGLAKVSGSHRMASNDGSAQQ